MWLHARDSTRRILLRVIEPCSAPAVYYDLDMDFPFHYNEDDPWHSHFFVMLSVRCNDCDKLADTADLFAKRIKDRRDGALERFCVQATDRLRKAGWQMLDKQSFCCPECWNKRSEAH
jgi:hypothetical protein